MDIYIIVLRIETALKRPFKLTISRLVVIIFHLF